MGAAKFAPRQSNTSRAGTFTRPALSFQLRHVPVRHMKFGVFDTHSENGPTGCARSGAGLVRSGAGLVRSSAGLLRSGAAAGRSADGEARSAAGPPSHGAPHAPSCARPLPPLEPQAETRRTNSRPRGFTDLR